jgi:hypothetical protein
MDCGSVAFRSKWILGRFLAGSQAACQIRLSVRHVSGPRFLGLLLDRVVKIAVTDTNFQLADTLLIFKL